MGVYYSVAGLTQGRAAKPETYSKWDFVAVRCGPNWVYIKVFLRVFMACIVRVSPNVGLVASGLWPSSGSAWPG